MAKTNPIRPTSDEARSLARDLIDRATFAALAVLDPQTGRPVATRIAVLGHSGGAITTLISDLSSHTRALRGDPRASLLVGEPGTKGDPLTYPRLSLSVTAEFVAKDAEDRVTLRNVWLHHRPKTKLYIDFADFNFVRFNVLSADLNGGFGKAFRLTPEDLSP